MSTRTRKPSVKLVHGQAITTSLKVAEVFGKRHTDVLRTIRNLECSPEFTERNFALSEYADTTGRKLPMYTITRDGFAFLASGFTGKEAAQWKEKYIAAFNELERRALEKATARRLPKPAAQAALPTPEKLEDLALARLRAGMFVLYFGTDGFMMLHSVSRQCVVAEPWDIANRIADPKDIPREFLPDIITAAAARLKP